MSSSYINSNSDTEPLVAVGNNILFLDIKYLHLNLESIIDPIISF